MTPHGMVVSVLKDHDERAESWRELRRDL